MSNTPEQRRYATNVALCVAVMTSVFNPFLLTNFMKALFPPTPRRTMEDRHYEVLEAAVKRNDLSAVNSAMAAGCNPNDTSMNTFSLWNTSGSDELFKEYPLVTAVRQRNYPIAAALVTKGALPDLQCSLPLSIAAEQGDIEMMRLLIRHGAVVNGSPAATNSYALYAAVGAGRFNAARFLLRCGANPNSRGPEETQGDNADTALQLARKNDNVLITNLLLRAGAKR